MDRITFTINNIEKARARREEYAKEYNRLFEICNNREISEKRPARNIARLMVKLLEEIEGVDELIKIYERDLEGLTS